MARQGVLPLIGAESTGEEVACGLRRQTQEARH